MWKQRICRCPPHAYSQSYLKKIISSYIALKMFVFFSIVIFFTFYPLIANPSSPGRILFPLSQGDQGKTFLLSIFTSEPVDPPPLCVLLRRLVTGRRILVPRLLLVDRSGFWSTQGRAFGRVATLLLRDNLPDFDLTSAYPSGRIWWTSGVDSWQLIGAAMLGFLVVRTHAHDEICCQVL